MMSESAGNGLVIGPVLPPELVSEDNTAACFVGPVIPETSGTSHNEYVSESDDGGTYGPALPPDMIEDDGVKVYGPTMPPNLDNDGNDDDDDDMVGPAPEEGEAEEDYERRMDEFKIRQAMLEVQ